MKKILTYAPSLLIFALAVWGLVWYVNTHEDVKEFVRHPLAKQQTSSPKTSKTPAKPAGKTPTVPQDPRVKILTAPPGTPSTVHTTSGGFVMDPRKQVFFPSVNGSANSKRFQKAIADLIEENKLDDYYLVRFANVPTSIPCTAPLPWVLQHCRSMCIVKDNQLLQVQGNGISNIEAKELLIKYKNW